MAAERGRAQPKASRPNLSAGYLEPKLLPWSWAVERLIESSNYWIASTRPDGRPHARPVWGVWLDEAVWFSTGGLIGRNLRANPEVSVNLESGDETVILEGRVEITREPALLKRFVEAYNPKYTWSFTPDQVGDLYIARPRLAFAWICDGTGLDGGATFSATATRFEFPGG